MNRPTAIRLVQTGAWMLGGAVAGYLLFREAVFFAGRVVYHFRPGPFIVGAWPPIDPVELAIAAVVFSLAGFATNLLGVGTMRLLGAPRIIAAVTGSVSVAFLGLLFFRPGGGGDPGLLRASVYFWTPALFSLLGAWLGSRARRTHPSQPKLAPCKES